jgi:hypothetical protein
MSDGIVKFVINSDKTMTEGDAKLYEMYKEHKHLTVTVRPGQDRTVLQNNLFFAMYKRSSETLGDQSILDIRKECKLLIGQPILYADDEKFRAGWDRYFKNETYEIQLHLMGPNKVFGPDGYPITRLFDRKQPDQYINGIIAHYPNVNFNDLLSDK